MEEGSTINAVSVALGRIDAALARIENAAGKTANDDGGLKERHHRLKASVAHALSDLDALIDELR